MEAQKLLVQYLLYIFNKFNLVINNHTRAFLFCYRYIYFFKCTQYKIFKSELYNRQYQILRSSEKSLVAENSL